MCQQGLRLQQRMKSVLLAVFALQLACVIQCLDIDLLNKQATYIDAKVGSYAVFDCPLDLPQDLQIPYILHWNKEVSELCINISEQGQPFDWFRSSSACA